MDNKAKTINNLIPKPIQRALYASISFGGFSFVLGVPSEYTPRVAIAGLCYSLYLSWKELGPRKRKKGRQVLLNGETIELEYSTNYITRETWGDTINRWVYGKDEIKESKPTFSVDKPDELNEFTFTSNGIQLRESHVKLFLKSAWRNRQYGKGLSERRWVREFNKRPAWYQELSTDWYYAMMQLLFNCQSGLSYQIIKMGANKWLDLANEPFTTIRLLKWYENERRKK